VGRAPETADGERRLRVDAQRNRAELLAAARHALVERGPDAPLEDIARRAGVGIGTLYRRFPDRATLLKAVVLDAMELTRQAADAIHEDGHEPFEAVARYMHAALDLEVAAVTPTVLDRLDLEDPDLASARDASARSVQRLIDAAHEAGTLPRDITFSDIGMLLVRLARPLPGGFDPTVNAQLAHRHLDLLLEGLGRPADRRGRAIGGPALSREELHQVQRRHGPAGDH
jgi:AcrR family transcriptional regulator